MSYYSKKNDDLSFIPLTVEEETELFRRYMASEKGAETADSLAARDALIANHLKLVAKLSLQVAKRFMLSEEEIISAGNLGLMKALNARRFNPSFGVRFGTYIRKYVRAEVLEAIDRHMEENRGVKARDDERSERGREFWDCAFTPTGKSLYTLFFSKKIELLTDHTFEEEELTSMREEVVAKALSSLSQVEAFIVREHYFNGKTLAAAGRMLDMGRNGAREAHRRGMAKLKEALAHIAAELC